MNKTVFVWNLSKPQVNMPNLAVTTNKFTRVYLEVDRKAKGHVIGVMKKNLNDITK